MDLVEGANYNAAAFLVHHKLKNENDIPLSFDRHKFLIDFYMDNSPRIVCKKCGQIGFSTAAIIRSFHLAKCIGANVIYTLPSKPIIKDFVTPKVNPLISNNPALQNMVGDVDSLGLKKVGDRFVYFRSSWDEASGISISAHILINDELDRSNQKAIRTYKTRLDASALDRPDLGWHWKFSNPSHEGYGVDEDWQISDQKHWFIKCSRCNHWQFMNFPESIDFEQKCYICQRCRRPLSDIDRINGRWVKKFLGREISGYWINQMMATWIPCAKVIEDSLGDQSVFYNFTLGQPFTSKDMQVTRQSIINCLYPDLNPRTDVSIGVDNGIRKHFVVGNKYGIFKVGSTESWQEIENMRNQYDAYMVIDANPYPTPVMELVHKYPGKVFANYYKEDTQRVGTIRFGEGDEFGIVKADRTKVIDSVVADINARDIRFNLSLTDLENEEYIQHWGVMYRIIMETEKGIKKPVWVTPDGKADHLAHATIYQQIAATLTLSYGSVVNTPSVKPQERDKAIYIGEDQQAIDGVFSMDRLKDQLERPKRKSWVKS